MNASFSVLYGIVVPVMINFIRDEIWTMRLSIMEPMRRIPLPTQALQPTVGVCRFDYKRQCQKMMLARIVHWELLMARK